MILFSCSIRPTEKEKKVFKEPEIINSLFADTTKAKLFTAECVSDIFPRFIGKFEFQEKIDIHPDKVQEIKHKDKIRDVYQLSINDSLDVNGFEVIVSYDKIVKYLEYDPEPFSYYPIFLVNTTNSSKLFLGKDSHFFGIQEGKTKEKYGKWQPIESRGYDFCGNGNWGVVVKPNEFVLLLMRRYEGSFETKLRVRILNGASIYVSKPFKGFINEEQFKISEKSYSMKGLQETNGSTIMDFFYGAIPREVERTEDTLNLRREEKTMHNKN